MSNNTKDAIKFISSVVVLVVGLTMTFISLFLPPSGEIHASVLTMLGEIFTFVGSVWGIASYTKIKLAAIDREAGDKVGNA